MSTSNVNSFLGIRVIESSIDLSGPKIRVRDIKLSDGTSILTPEFRASIDRFFLNMFGPDDSTVYVMSGPFGDAFALNLKQVVIIKNLLKSK